MSSMIFRPAARNQSKLRLGMSGPSGAGKTYSSLVIATAIAAVTGDKIAVIDTENGSASLYAEDFTFDCLNLQPPYSPDRFVDAIHAAEEAGYGIILIDSITHEWKGVGGVLEIVDKLARASSSGNSYVAWSKVDPQHRRFVDAMLSSPAHIIATMRSKTAYVEGERAGKKTYTKAGMAPEQRDGIEYEFTLVFDLLDGGRNAIASKDRTKMFYDPTVITPDTGRMLIDWLMSAKPEPARTTASASSGTAGSAAGQMTDDDYNAHQLALESCNTSQELGAAWDSAKTACKEIGDTASYALLKTAMEKAAAAIKAATEPPEGQQGQQPPARPARAARAVRQPAH